MALSNREIWGTLHGLIFGALFLLSFSGGLFALYSLRPEWSTEDYENFLSTHFALSTHGINMGFNV